MIFYNADLGMISPVVSNYWDRPVEELLRKSGAMFTTNVPDFADKVALSRLFQSKGVIVNASPPSSGPGVLVTLLLSFGPTLLFIGLLVLLFRRAGGAGMGALSSFGRSGAARV